MFKKILFVLTLFAASNIAYGQETSKESPIKRYKLLMTQLDGNKVLINQIYSKAKASASHFPIACTKSSLEKESFQINIERYFNENPEEFNIMLDYIEKLLNETN